MRYLLIVICPLAIPTTTYCNVIYFDLRVRNLITMDYRISSSINQDTIEKQGIRILTVVKGAIVTPAKYGGILDRIRTTIARLWKRPTWFRRQALLERQRVFAMSSLAHFL